MKGFTLIEVLIYSALFAFILSMVLVSVYQIMQSSNSLDIKNVTEAEANFLLRKMGWALSSVSTINFPVAGSSSSTLSVSRINFSQNPIVFSSGNNNLTIKRGSEATAILNSQSISINSVSFLHLAAAGDIPEAVRINLTVNSKTYQTTIYLKK
jgi:type II secretory pathway component PulJ